MSMFKFLGKKLRELFKGKIDDSSIEELEELFFEADLGSAKSAELASKVRSLYKANPNLTQEEILEEIKKNLLEELAFSDLPQKIESKPHVIMIVGVNGNGKTTTVAKLASYYQKMGKTVLIAAADTFRAAATEQLEKWSAKLESGLVKGKQGSDPAAVVFDAIESAKARNYDIVLIDTAGRLHTKNDLMKELEKIRRVSAKSQSGAPHETFLILDATIGQNAVEQAMVFHKFTPLTGLVLTKFDGTAKGGAVLSLQQKLRLPIRFLGTGESIDAIEPFDPKEFINSLLS